MRGWWSERRFMCLKMESIHNRKEGMGGIRMEHVYVCALFL